MPTIRIVIAQALRAWGLVALVILVGCATPQKRTPAAQAADDDPTTRVRSEQLTSLAEDEAADVQAADEPQRLRAIENTPARKRGSSLPGGQ